MHLHMLTFVNTTTWMCYKAEIYQLHHTLYTAVLGDELRWSHGKHGSVAELEESTMPGHVQIQDAKYAWCRGKPGLKKSPWPDRFAAPHSTVLVQHRVSSKQMAQYPSWVWSLILLPYKGSISHPWKASVEGSDIVQAISNLLSSCKSGNTSFELHARAIH